MRKSESYPLTNLHLYRIEQLERLVPVNHYQGWGYDGGEDPYFVDVGVPGKERRYRGATLHQAIGKAIRAQEVHRESATS